MEIDSSTDRPEYRAMEEERSAAKRISAAHERAAQAEREADKKIDEIKDEFVRSEAMESARQENAIAEQKQKGYEHLRELQRTNSRDVSKARHEGDRDLLGIEDYYKGAIAGAQKRGSEELDHIQQSRDQRAEYQKRIAAADLDAENAEFAHKYNDIKDYHDKSLTELSGAAQKEYETKHTQFLEAGERANQQFQDQYQHTLQTEAQALENLDRHASRKVREIRQDTSQKLDAYSSRQSDPFYKMMDMGAALSETSDAFILTATIPEHERDHVSVSVHGNEVTLSGARRNEEKLELAPGQKQSTSSYQSYTQSFPLYWPVEARKITRYYDGDQLVVTIPKSGIYARRPTPPAHPAERVRAERPHFPGNLPHAEGEKVAASGEAEAPKSDKPLLD